MHSEVRRRSRRWSESARAFKRLVHDHCNATGDQESDVAAVLNIAPSYLSNLMNGQRVVPVDLLIHATRALGDTSAIAAVCRMCGGTFRRDPDVEHVAMDVVHSMKETTDPHQVILTAMDDGHITRDELAHIRKEFTEALEAIHALMADCEAQANGRNDGRVASLAEAQARAGK